MLFEIVTQGGSPAIVPDLDTLIARINKAPQPTRPGETCTLDLTESNTPCTVQLYALRDSKFGLMWVCPKAFACIPGDN